MGGTLGAEISAAIVQQGLTNKEVSLAIGISPQYMVDLAKDRRTPSDKVLEKIVKHLHINRNYAYYLVNRYPPEIRDTDVSLVVLDKALDWLLHPYEYTLTKTGQPKDKDSQSI